MSDPARASQSRPRGRSAGSLTPQMSVSEMCWGGRLMVAEMRVKTLPFSRKTPVRNDPECCLAIDRIPGRNPGRFCRRSGARFSGSAWARQGFARSARRCRALDPPGALPSGWQLPERRRDSRVNLLRIPSHFCHASGRLQSCVLTSPTSKPHDRSTMFFSLV